MHQLRFETTVAIILGVVVVLGVVLIGLLQAARGIVQDLWIGVSRDLLITTL